MWGKTPALAQAATRDLDSYLALHTKYIGDGWKTKKTHPRIVNWRQCRQEFGRQEEFKSLALSMEFWREATCQSASGSASTCPAHSGPLTPHTHSQWAPSHPSDQTSPPATLHRCTEWHFLDLHLGWRFVQLSGLITASLFLFPSLASSPIHWDTVYLMPHGLPTPSFFLIDEAQNNVFNEEKNPVGFTIQMKSFYTM